MSEFIASIEDAMALHGDLDCRMYVITDTGEEFSAPINMAVVEASGVKTFYVAEFPAFDGQGTQPDKVVGSRGDLN